MGEVSFGQWVDAVFEREVTGGGRGPGLDTETPELRPETRLVYLTELLERSGQLLSGYDDQQVAQGLHLVRGPIGEPVVYQLHNTKLTGTDRCRCIAAAFNLFDQLFATRCGDRLALTDLHVAPLDQICREWWTSFPLTTIDGDRAQAAIEQQCLETLKQVLALDSLACQESALTGLGSWRDKHPGVVRETIDAYLGSAAPTEPLRDYAQVMRDGERDWVTDTFEDWLASVFDHSVRKPEWWWDRDCEAIAPDPSVGLDYLTQLFSNPHELLSGFSDGQVNQGLWFLADNACSDHAFALLNETIDWARRAAALKAFETLFEQVFAERCTDHLSHLDEPGVGPVNMACYMWWDLLPISGASGTDQLQETCLEVMRNTLALDSIACQESALHGLGHWHMYHPERGESIIDEFLAAKPNLYDPLRTYAANARRGCVQ